MSAQKGRTRFDPKKFFVDVFDPEAGEKVWILVDDPKDGTSLTDAWKERHCMAAEWREVFYELGQERSFHVGLLFAYEATGAHGTELPDDSRLNEILESASLIIAMTQFSATAPLSRAAVARGGVRALRVASMPTVEKRMEETALAADYNEVAKRCHIIGELLRGAESVTFEFSTGHVCKFDTRFRVPDVDDGYLHRDKQERFPGTNPVINLPAGEAFVVPYEGERVGIPSRTSGTIPVWMDDSIAVFDVDQNRIVRVSGNDLAAQHFDQYFNVDPARSNIAEVAFGCNSWAEVTGNVLEDEKAGPHWANGRSEHLGGVWGPDKFSKPEHIVHQDYVYAKGCPIFLKRAYIGDQLVIEDGSYLL